ncbi:MAG: hypothetical protein RJA87_1080 [Pseudomonadota bacterium]|jgi:hypothetical protein
MRKIVQPLALIAALIATPAMAVEGAATIKIDPSIPLAPVAVPIIENGKLVNYVFLSIKIMLSPKADLYRLVGQEPYYRDALVRAGHRQNLGVPGDPNRVDEKLVKAVLKREAASFMDARMIASIEIVRQDPKKRVARSVPAKP